MRFTVALLQLSALFLFTVIESKKKNVICLKLKHVWLFKYLYVHRWLLRSSEFFRRWSALPGFMEPTGQIWLLTSLSPWAPIGDGKMYFKDASRCHSTKNAVCLWSVWHFCEGLLENGKPKELRTWSPPSPLTSAPLWGDTQTGVLRPHWLCNPPLYRSLSVTFEGRLGSGTSHPPIKDRQ